MIPEVSMVKCLLFTAALFLAFISHLMASTATADGHSTPPSRSFTFYWENDAFTGTDRDYTNGLKLTWSRPYETPDDGEQDLTDWMMGHLPFMGDAETFRATSFSIGQNIYTPEDTESSNVVEDDRPYAGFSYIGFGFVSNNGKRRDVWEIDIGVVGPLSQAQFSQDVVHDIIGSDRAQGWDHQLENELALELICESKWRLWQTSHHSGFGADFIPHVGGRAGNVAIYANAGAELRFGWLMPRDFGTCPIRPGCNVGDAVGGAGAFSETGSAKLAQELENKGYEWLKT